ncbi:MAG: flagellin, partial [Firmicutes bacterium]|nr:flagellin [Bacillota bacterium]
MRINHNISALNAWQSLGQTDNAMTKSLERLSSGLRINRAADDAAGLAISEKMRGQIRGLNQAVRNAQDAISLIQTAEGALNETHSILQRMRELAVQSATDTNTYEDRLEIQKEMDQLATELTRIADTTEFNTKELLVGTFKGIFHIGANERQNMTLEIGAMGADALKVSGNPGAQFGVEVDTTGLELKDTAMADGGKFNVVKFDEFEWGDNKTAKFGLANKDGEIVALSEDGTEYTVLAEAVAIDDVENATAAAEDKKFEFGDPVVSGEVTVEVVEDNVESITAMATAAITEGVKLAPGKYTIEAGTGSFNGQTVLLDSDGKVAGVWEEDTEGGGSFVDPLDNSVVFFTIAGGIGDDGSGNPTITEITIGAGEGIDVSTQKAADAAIKTIQEALDT